MGANEGPDRSGSKRPFILVGVNNSVNKALFTELFTPTPGARPVGPGWSGPSYGSQNYPETPKKHVGYVSALPGCETLLKSGEKGGQM